MRYPCKIMFLLFGAMFVTGCGQAEFKEFTSQEGKFKVQMPGTPKKQEQETFGAKLVTYSVEQRNGAYAANFADMPIPAGESAEKLEDRLDGAQAGALGNIKAKLIDSKKVTLENKYPGREFNGELPDNKGMIRARVFLVNTRMYQIIVIGTKSFVNSADASKFLNSLTLVP